MKNIEKVRFRGTEGYKNTRGRSRDNELSHYNHLFLGMSLGVICFMLLVVGISVVGATITGTAPNPAGDTIIDQDTVWDGEDSIYCGGDIIVGNPTKRIHLVIKNSHITVESKWAMGGDTPVNFTLLNSTIFWEVTGGRPTNWPSGGVIDTDKMIVIESISDHSKVSRIELRDSTIQGTDARHRTGGVQVKSGGIYNSIAKHTVIADNVTFKYMGALCADTGAGYWALNVRYWDTCSYLASDSILTHLNFDYCGKGIKLCDNIELDYATSKDGWSAFTYGKYYNHLTMNRTCEGLYEPTDDAWVRNSWFDGRTCKFNFNTGSNGIFEHNYVQNARFNAGDAGGNNNTIQHNTFYQTVISSRKNETKYINNSFDSPPHNINHIDIRGFNQLVENNTMKDGDYALYIEPHPFISGRTGGHVIKGNIIDNAQRGIYLWDQDNNIFINNTILRTYSASGIHLTNCINQLFRDTSISNTALNDIVFAGDNDNIKFINTKSDENKVYFADSSDIFLNYHYLDTKVVDSNGNSIQGATVTITNDVDSNYPSINAKGETKTSFTTGADGHTPLPSDPENSIAIIDYWQNSATKTEMSYTITAEKEGYGNSITVNPDTWYRSDPNTYQNTVTIVLGGILRGPDTTPPTITTHSPTGSNVPVDTDISVTFSEAMNKASAESAFSISPLGSGSFSWDGNQMTFNPNSNLSYETTYTLTIGTGAEDLAWNDLASPYSWQFTSISDTTAPVISNVAATGITDSSATITWTTDEASTSQVEYGLTTTYGSSTTLDTNLVTTHSQTITGLTHSTTYHYRVKSMDASDNLAISADSTFTTSESEEDALLGYWRFDDGSGNEAYDSSGNGNDGTINGATWNTGKSGSALDFGGGNDYVDCGNDASFDFTGAFTIEAWIKPDVLSGYKAIAVKRGSQDQAVYGLWTSNDVTSNDVVYYEVKNFDRSSSATDSGSSTLSAGEWHHIVLQRDSDDYIKLYVDGALDKAGSQVTGLINPPESLFIGRHSLVGNQYFDGIIDEVRIYNRALSAEEIMAHYEAGLEDTTTSTITVHSPTGSNVPIDTDISVTFSEAMNKASAESAFSISPLGSGSFSWDGNQMTFNPNSNLSYETTYTLTIGTGAEDLAWNDLASPYSWQFTTEEAPDTTAPVISNVAATGITDSSATITWTTDEASTSQVEYGLTTTYGSSTTLDTNLVTTHSQTITGLTHSTTYHYRVKSMDASDNLAISADSTFTTSESEEDALLGYWRFDDGSGNEAYDSSGNGNDGTINGATWNTGKSGSALDFGGGNDYVDCGNDASLDFTGAFTIEAWIKPDVLSGYKAIAVKRGSQDQAVYGLWTSNDVTSNDVVYYEVKNFDRSSSATDSGSSTLSAGEWHHIVLQRDSDDYIKLYVDGALDKAGSQVTGLINPPESLFIGRHSLVGNQYFDGIIDEVRIYNRALSAEEIMAHYEAGLEDTTTSTITVHSPTGSNVPIDTDISVTFSEAMNKASAESAFSISPLGSGSFSWDGNQMTFNPNSNLSYETTYTLTIGTGAEDLAGNNLASPYNWQFTTEEAPDTTAPVISNVAATGITGSSATITWTTDEPATSQVEYGLTTAYGSSTTMDTNLVTTHSQTITGLTPYVTYHYRVKSMDASDNLAISADSTFTTPESEEDGLLGYWRFDEGEGTTAYDSSGNGNDGTINGATWTAGKSGSALDFDGGNDDVDCGNDASFDFTGAFTIEAWIKPDVLSGYKAIAVKRGSQAQAVYGLWTSKDVTSNDVVYYEVKNFDRSSSATGSGSSTLSAGEWHHIVLQRDSDDYINLYVDGALDKTGSQVTGLINPPESLFIGRHSLVGNQYFDGIIDEVLIYNRALSAEEIMVHYESGLEDTTPPTITAHSPEGSNVSLDADISVTFSETMNKASVESAFSISPAVSCSFNWDGNQMTFNPTSNLSYDATYTVTLGTGAEDLAGNNLASPYNWQFTTTEAPDTTAPVLSNVAATGITGSSATITWTTDEPATSQVEYGLTTAYGSSTTMDTNLVTSHSQTITGLTPYVTYHYRVKSMDASDNLAISADSTFTTPESEEDGLLGYWRFDEGEGTTAYDSSGNGNDGTINGATWTAGKSGSALDFDGGNDDVDCGNDASFDFTGAFTIEAWIKPDVLSGYKAIAVKRGSQAQAVYGLWTSKDVTSNDVVYYEVKNFDRSSSATGSGSSTLSAGEWHHIVLQRDSDDYINLYVDGALDKAGSQVTGLINPPESLFIGRHYLVGNQYFDGIIDEVLIYNRALSAEEIMAHYESGY